MKTIKICMGSSCFARENRDNLAKIEEYLALYGLTDSVQIAGSLCMGKCADGPNIMVGDTLYSKVLPEQINDILDKELQPK